MMHVGFWRGWHGEAELSKEDCGTIGGSAFDHRAFVRRHGRIDELLKESCVSCDSRQRRNQLTGCYHVLTGSAHGSSPAGRHAAQHPNSIEIATVANRTKRFQHGVRISIVLQFLHPSRGRGKPEFRRNAPRPSDVTQAAPRTPAKL